MVVSGTKYQKAAAIAALQRGRVARRQLLAAGVTRKMIATMLAGYALHPLHAGVYAFGHPGPVEFGAETAALLACGDGAVLSHATAGTIWSIRVARPADDPIEVTLTRGRGARRSGIRIRRSRTLLGRDIRIREGLPITSPARTLLDYAGSATEREAELALDDAFVKRIVSRSQLLDVLDRAPRRPGTPVLTRFLKEQRHPTVTRSEAEEWFLSLTRSADLPSPEINVPLGRFVVDFLWPSARLIVEIDGYRYHGGRRSFELDRARDAALGAAGFLVLRFTWMQLKHEPYAVIGRLARALAWADAKHSL